MIKNGALKNLSFFCILLMLLALGNIGCSNTANPSKDTYHRPGSVLKPADAKKLLVEGNKRFVSGKVLNDDISEAKRKDLSTNGQHPFAIIVGCSDSRVPPEIILLKAA